MDEAFSQTEPPLTIFITLDLYLPTWQPIHLLVLGQIPGENKQIGNPPPKILAAGPFPKKGRKRYGIQRSFHDILSHSKSESILCRGQMKVHAFVLGSG
jgi:hypothetical protein